MAIVSTSSLRPLPQYSSFPKCPNFSHYSRFRPRIHFSSLRLSSSAIRATAAVALEPVNTHSPPLSLPSIIWFHYFLLFASTTVTHVVYPKRQDTVLTLIITVQVFVFMFLFIFIFNWPSKLEVRLCLTAKKKFCKESQIFITCSARKWKNCAHLLLLFGNCCKVSPISIGSWKTKAGQKAKI